MSDDTAPPELNEVATIGSFTASGASYGGWIGAIVGGVIGIGVVVYQRLSKKDPYEDYVSPEPERRKHSHADEGNPAPVCYGKWVRCPGQVIALSSIQSDPAVTHNIENKEKDGPDETVVLEYRYVCDIAIAWCRSPILNVKRIYANGEIIYDNSTLSDNDYSVSAVLTEQFDNCANSNKNSSICNVIEFVIFKISLAVWDSTDTGWSPGTIFNIEGGTGSLAANTGKMTLNENRVQGSFRYLKFRKCNYAYDNDTGDCKTPSNNCACAGIAQPGGGNYTFNGIGVSIEDGVSNKKYMDAAKHYLGNNANELPDPVVEDFVRNPADDVAYRWTAYTRITRLNVTKWGNTLPRFEAFLELREGDEGEDVSRVLRDIIERGDTLRGIEIDVTQVAGKVDGYMIMGPTSIGASVQELMMYYFLEATEQFKRISGGDLIQPTLVFRPITDADQFLVPAYDRGAHEAGSNSVDFQVIGVDDNRGLPTNLVMDFVSSNNDFQVGSIEYANQPAQTKAVTTTKIRTDLVLSYASAYGLAKTFLYNSQVYRDSFRATLPPNYLEVRPGDRITWQAKGLTELVDVRLSRVTRGANGLIEIEGMIDDGLSYTQIDDDIIPPASPIPPRVPEAIGYVLDLAPIRPEHCDSFGIYYHIATFAADPNLNDDNPAYNLVDGADSLSRRSRMLRSPNDGDDWYRLGEHNGRVTHGWVVSDPLGPSDCITWDTENTIDVQVHTDANALTSATREDVAARKRNIAVVGEEVIGYSTVEYLGDNVYRLSDLLRGLLDTEPVAYEGKHNDGENLISLIGNNVKFAPLPPDEYKREQDAIVIPDGRDTTNEYAQSFPFVADGETLRPFRPRGRWVRRYPDQTYRHYFRRSTRVPFRQWSGLNTPLCERSICFKMDVYYTGENGTDDPVFIRCITCCFQVNERDELFYMSYTREQQANDFHKGPAPLLPDGTFPKHLEFRLSQCSDTLGPVGRESIFCVQFEGPFVSYSPECITF